MWIISECCLILFKVEDKEAEEKYVPGSYFLVPIISISLLILKGSINNYWKGKGHEQIDAGLDSLHAPSHLILLARL